MLWPHSWPQLLAMCAVSSSNRQRKRAARQVAHPIHFVSYAGHLQAWRLSWALEPPAYFIRSPLSHCCPTALMSEL